MPALTALLLLSPALLPAQTPSTAAIEVPFRLGDDAIIVDATVNGRKVSLMFDTGFSGTVVLDSRINIGRATGSMTLRDFVGEFQAPTVPITSMSLGAKKIDVGTEMRAVMSPNADYSLAYNTHCDGILGYEPFTKYVMEINFERSRFIFHPRTLDISKRTPDNTRTFLAKLLPKGHQSLEMEVLTSQDKRLVLALDTGNAFYATTHKDKLQAVGLWPEAREPQFLKSSMVASGEVTSWYKKMRDMRIFGVPVPESVWSIIDLPSSSAESDGTVGFGFLRNFNVILDFERRRVWLDNFSGKVGSEAAGDLGISAFWDEERERLRIFRVSPGSPAEKGGVKRGDFLLSIDGNTELNVGYRRLERMMQGPVGSKVKLVLSRNGSPVRLELERKPLVNE